MDWQEVKTKPKRKAKGPAKQESEGGFSNSNASSGVQKTVSKQAQFIADYDDAGNSDEEIKFESVSHDCAIAVANARTHKEMSQA